MVVAGIDPGNKGCICILNNADAVFADFHKNSLAELYSFILNNKVEQIWIEDVHSLYGMSAKSNFNFGRNLGMVQALAEISVGSYSQVPPKVWQAAVGITAKGKAIKNQVAEIAINLYPSVDLLGKRGGLIDGRSDALMIAHYGLHIGKNTNEN
jgi:Holliday junction resolvasome RuvABC endonuclease subunit